MILGRLARHARRVVSRMPGHAHSSSVDHASHHLSHYSGHDQDHNAEHSHDHHPEQHGAIVVFGATSEIGLAILRQMLARQHAPVVLLGRSSSPRRAQAMAAARQAGATSVRWIGFDAADTAVHPQAVAQAFSHPVQAAIVAFGVLGDQEQAWTDHHAAVTIFRTNTTAAASIGVLIAEQMRTQRAAGVRGQRIIAISSVAGEKVRRSNFVYGASKAGMDGFYRGLGEALRPEGIRVLVVRPGFVRSKMTAGRSAALAVSPEQVATKVIRADDRGAELVRVPAIFGPIMVVFKLLPAPIVRHLPW